MAEQLAGEQWLLFACGRYEGIDARVLDYAGARMPVDEVSLGDYVLAGGEAAVLVIVEAIARLLPGVLGNAASAPDDSFGAGPAGLLEAPAYTKPASGAAWTCRRCCCRAITARSRGGGPSSRASAPPRVVPTCWIEGGALRAMRLQTVCCGIIEGLPARVPGLPRATLHALI